MAKFYKHDIQAARDLHADYHRKSTAKHPAYSDLWYVENTILHLAHIAEVGLPDCYDSYRDYLYDFWPSLPWNEEGSNRVAGLIIQDPRFAKIAADIKKEWDYDMTAELTVS